jgi:hypothetical protein
VIGLNGNLPEVLAQPQQLLRRCRADLDPGSRSIAATCGPRTKLRA